MCSSDNASNDVGVVYKKTTGFYLVKSNCAPGKFITCELSPRLRRELIYPLTGPSHGTQRARRVVEHDRGDPLAIGDVVQVVPTGSGTGLIVAVHPRRSQLTRRAAASRWGAHTFEQVIAVNIDQVVPVFAAASPAPHWNLLDRYLAAAELADLPARICITKLDLAQDVGGRLDQDIQTTADEYQRIGYPVIQVSAVTGDGLDTLREILRDRVSVLVGKSGVGKTSLLNALQPGLDLRVRDVSRATGKGKHTTSWLELFDLDFGGAVLDTPGVREFGLWDVDPDDLDRLFLEMRPWLGQCRFGLDCRHDEEPGCAVRRAVIAGQISPRRYHSYLRLREDGGQR